ncbi:protease modulator HflC [Falsirhodobacter algicola]|uniref:Protein HflC n=1 Tax=Falsirhodobacter algicola TaxID=2692330 RepID=A0A8J8MUE4_9RHOB|nr:protease modulator HflC [Falsirhodobacter algicola]QUS36714.1 protease modulator HflC [Falsirhodobacter algicola]
MTRAIYIIPVLILILVVALSSIFIVDEREKVLVLQFGQVKAVREEPGIGFKIPMIQDVVRYDGRILSLQTQPLEVTPLDDRRLIVDAFARWRIMDLVEFRESVGTGGIATAQTRLERIMTAAIREVLGGVNSDRVLSDDRIPLMVQIRDIARRQAEALGIEVIDVRLTRTDLPQQNLAATYARMQAERQREAADEIARGNEAAQRIRAEADRQVVETTSQANADAEVIRGQAEAERNRILAEAYNRDPEFFAFTRSLQAYGKALARDGSSIVMTPSSEFFRYLQGPTASAAN